MGHDKLIICRVHPIGPATQTYMTINHPRLIINNKYHSYMVPDAIRHVVRVCGGCGVLDLNGPEVDCLLCQWGGFVPYWGPRGALIQYLTWRNRRLPSPTRINSFLRQ
jgi:hypothetical protein